MNLNLDGKIAVLTAASKGLGKAVAMKMAQEGADIIICSSSEEIFVTAKEIKQISNVNVDAEIVDILNKNAIDAFIQRVMDKYARIDILFLNTGGPPPGNFSDFGVDDWDKAYKTTIRSVLNVCYAVVPIMRTQGFGSIVANQSVSVKQPIDNLILSNSLRMAVIGLMKSLANELGPQGIRVNTINPTWTKTDRVAQLMEDRANRNSTSIEEEAAKVSDVIPLGRMGTVEEYANVVAWLASPVASFIHGQAIMFDGGAVKTPL